MTIADTLFTSFSGKQPYKKLSQEGLNDLKRFAQEMGKEALEKRKSQPYIIPPRSWETLFLSSSEAVDNYATLMPDGLHDFDYGA